MKGSIWFEDVIDKMPTYLKTLEACSLMSMDTNEERRRLGDNLPARGVYVLYEGGKPKYVGRSDRLKERLLEHGRSSSISNGATLAFQITTNEFQKRHPGASSMKKNALEANLQFQDLFVAAKNRVRKMDIRVVEIQDAIEQTIFEVYAHMTLGTEYNSFHNH